MNEKNEETNIYSEILEYFMKLEKKNERKLKVN
jgi:hypothetical protein